MKIQMKKKIKLITKYFTFGQDHIHKIDGVIYDRDCVIKITAVNPRSRMFELFGVKWSTEYNSLKELNIKHYPRGIFERD